MFTRLFNLEAPFWVGVSKVADLVWLNLLFIATSIPVVTIGAALTALYDTAWRQGEEVGSSVTREYFHSFRENLGKATALWIIVGPIGVALAFSWLFLPLRELVVLKVLFSLVYLLIFPYVWFLQSRFENTLGHTLRNAFLIPLSRLPYAVGTLAINTTILALFVWTAFDLPQMLPLAVLVGFSLPVAATMPLLKRTISPWVAAPTVTAAGGDVSETVTKS